MRSYIPTARLTTLALAFVPDCTTAGDPFLCRMHNLLHILYVLGATLAVILIGVVIFAVRAWRTGRNTQEIPLPKPDRERPHE